MAEAVMIGHAGLGRGIVDLVPAVVGLGLRIHVHHYNESIDVCQWILQDVRKVAVTAFT